MNTHTHTPINTYLMMILNDAKPAPPFVDHPHPDTDKDTCDLLVCRALKYFWKCGRKRHGRRVHWRRRSKDYQYQR